MFKFCCSILLLVRIGLFPNVEAAAIKPPPDAINVKLEFLDIMIEKSEESLEIKESGVVQGVEEEQYIDLALEELSDLDQALIEQRDIEQASEDVSVTDHVLELESDIDQVLEEERDVAKAFIYQALEEESDIDQTLQDEERYLDQTVVNQSSKDESKTDQAVTEEDKDQSLEEESIIDQAFTDEDLDEAIKEESHIDQAFEEESDIDQAFEEESNIDQSLKEENDMDQVVEEITTALLPDNFVYGIEYKHKHPVLKEDIVGYMEDLEIEEVLDDVEKLYEHHAAVSIPKHLIVTPSPAEKDSEEQEPWSSIDQDFLLQLENLNNMDDFVEKLDSYVEELEPAQDRADIMVHDDDLKDLEENKSSSSMGGTSEESYGEEEDSLLGQFFTFFG